MSGGKVSQAMTMVSLRGTMLIDCVFRFAGSKPWFAELALAFDIKELLFQGANP
jgi:hypothetical protein